MTPSSPSKIEHIIVHEFMFCAAHGDEYCQRCCCDHRMVNNVTIEEELGDMSEFLGFEVEERQPLNAYVLGAVAALHTEESYQCEKHKTVDCSKCFDWTSIIKREAEEAEEGGRWMSKRNSLQEQLESGVLTALPVQGASS
ncbi:hypothetical protein P691DRAFT_801831 [Macrolepiota fuliginosa MF-IS2]|uniref:Uncharacterized protein n=1 Tax=Macrolepiota fuliginosa MF-IS2 TaxID=1400762 RepID=A0A9P5XCG7_9AGAR|nr:hypothetical protein P691DRAFT_801831 [Macrolepiota fuliginosa MF-IS2]